MKNVYIIGGTMGVGKTTVCQLLKKRLDNSAFLDGDWCWDMNPFQVTQETKEMVVDNISYSMNNYIRCTAYDNVIFCWVMHEQSIIDDILSRLNTDNCRVKLISLICDEKILRDRLQKDVLDKKRTYDVIKKSIDRLPLYEKLCTTKINVSEVTPKEIVNKIIDL